MHTVLVSGMTEYPNIKNQMALWYCKLSLHASLHVHMWKQYSNFPFKVFYFRVGNTGGLERARL